MKISMGDIDVTKAAKILTTQLAAKSCPLFLINLAMACN